MLPDSDAADQIVREILDVARRRALTRHALQAGIAAFAGLAVLTPIVAPSPRGVLIFSACALTALAASVRFRSKERTAKAVAASIESRHPHLQNLAVTAEELLRHPDRAPVWVRNRVFADAAAALRPVHVSRLWPVWRLAAGVTAAAAVAATALAFTPRRDATSDARDLMPGATKGAGVVEIELTPPSYTGRPVVRLQDPERVEAIAGTVARVLVTNARDVRIRLGARPLDSRTATGYLVAEASLTHSGYLAVEISGAEAATRLIPLTVVPDRTPTVRIERPARDLLLPDARSTVDVTASAADDVAISALTLHYTKVSGSGEQIDFLEGDLPLQVVKENERQWRATGAIPLPRLGLEAGDSLVYRLLARDGRSGEAGQASSDTYFIEIAGPGQVPLEGVEMPPEQERYALSQQMIVLKIRRLRERERRLLPASLAEQAGAIAAEQRSVRANFVFLMGGHVEDEEEEAEQSHEVQEGRLENNSRRDISRAVSHMTSAEQALAARDTAGALSAATQAVEALQRAFGRNRYILRTLASRTALDPSRRLTGARADAERGMRTPAAAAGDPQPRAARELLARVLGLVAQAPLRESANMLSQLSEAGEAALAVDPDDRTWQETSAAVLRLRGRIASGAHAAEIDAAVRDVVSRLTTQALRGVPTITKTDAYLLRLEGALLTGGRGR